EETRREIHEVAERIGYKYSRNKNGLKKIEKQHFILLASTFALSQVSFFGKIIESLKDIVHDNNQSFEIIEVPINRIDEQNNILFRLSNVNNKIAGIFILSHITNKFIKKVIELDYPTTLIDHHSPQLKADTV